jgi:hypothetical protein
VLLARVRRPFAYRRKCQVHRGDLEDLESLRSGAAKSDGVIHMAFIHDFSKFEANREIDRCAIAAFGTALAGSDRPFVVTFGTALLVPGGLAIEGTVRADVRFSLDSPRRFGSGSRFNGGAWRARDSGAPSAVGPWRPRSRLRSAFHRDRAEEGRFCVWK